MMDARCGYFASQRRSDPQVAVAANPSMVHFRPRNIMAATTAICALAAVSSCSPVPDLPPAPAQPPPTTGYVSSLQPYRIQVGDVLDIRLMLNPELNEEVAVRPDGYISTTVARNELAYGRTVPELTAALTRAYSADLRNPRISVILRSFAPTRIYVGGEVNNPGEFIDVGPTLTLSQAMARAGGLKFTTSDESKIFIIRRGPNDVPEFFSTRKLLRHFL